MDYGHWDISEVGEFNPAEYIGFVYIIIFSDGKKYIGSKKLWKRTITAPYENSVNCSPSHWKHYKSSHRATKYKISTKKCEVVFKILSLYTTYFDTLQAEAAAQTTNDVINNKAFLNDGIAKTSGFDTNAISESVQLKWQDPTFRSKVCDAQRAGKIEYWTNVHMDGVMDGSKKFCDYFPYVPTRTEHELELAAAQQRYYTKCKNISKSLIGRKLGPESIEKMRNSKSGTTHTDEHRNKIKKSLEGKQKTPEHTKNAMAGRKRDANGKCIKSVIDKLIIDDIEYRSVRDAAIKLGTSEYIISKMIKQNKATAIYKNK